LNPVRGTKKSASLNLPTLARWQTSNSLPFGPSIGFQARPVKLQFRSGNHRAAGFFVTLKPVDSGGGMRCCRVGVAGGKFANLGTGASIGKAVGGQRPAPRNFLHFACAHSILSA
jgi:hypothetical protein